MSALQVVLLGGLELWSRGRRRPNFESKKTAALFAYLMRQRGKEFSREHLAGLLWPEAGEERARANLRQALYNIRQLLPTRYRSDWLLRRREGIRIPVRVDVTVDCEVFEAILSKHEEGAENTHALTRAAALFRGAFLDGLTLPDCEAFETWLLTEREHLRRAVVGALEHLVEAYIARGEFRLGLHFVTRLIELEPFSESAHRARIRLLLLAGERRRALAHYRELENLLQAELGVAPQEETQQLLAEVGRAHPSPRLADEGKRLRPVIPMVGRETAYERLRECWRLVASGLGVITLVEGEEGIGKTRLVRTFLDELSGKRDVLIVPTRCPAYLSNPYEPVGEALERLLAADPLQSGARLHDLPYQSQLALDVLAPNCRPFPHASFPPGEVAKLLARGTAELLRRFSEGSSAGARPSPVIIFIDDVEFANPSTVRLLREVAHLTGGMPVWFILAGTKSPDILKNSQGASDPMSPPLRVMHLGLERLTARDFEEIARGLVGSAEVKSLALAMARMSSGLPLACALFVNSLCEEDVIVPSPVTSSRWQISDRRRLQQLTALTEAELVLRRLAALPPSVRRTACLAAVAGDAFDVDLLTQAEGELAEVVELALKVLLEKWWLRQSPIYWRKQGLEAGVGLWRSGARGLRLDFDQLLVRRAILHSLHPRRRRVLHRLLAIALEEVGAPPGLLAHHLMGAEDWLGAAREALKLIEKARSAEAEDDIPRALRLARWAMGQVPAQGGAGDAAGRGWRELRLSLDLLESTLRQTSK